MFNLYDVETFYSQVPQNAKVCIWGVANAGMSIKEELAKYTKVLYAQARLIEGLPIESPTEISNLVVDIMSKK